MPAFAKTFVIIACITFCFIGMSFAAPEGTRKAGLDFWNIDEEKNRLVDAGEEARRLDAVSERLAIRIAVSERLASGLFENGVSLVEALDELMGLAQDDPEWFANLRSILCLYGAIQETAVERDVLATSVERLRACIGTLCTWVTPHAQPSSENVWLASTKR